MMPPLRRFGTRRFERPGLNRPAPLDMTDSELETRLYGDALLDVLEAL
jgi:hypothetical protein